MGLTVVLAVIGGGLAGVIASVYTQESLKDYLQSLTTRPDVSLISQVKPETLPGTYKEALAKVMEVALPSSATLRPKTTDSTNPLAWLAQTENDRAGVIVTNDGWLLFAQPSEASWLPSTGNAEVWVAGERYEIADIVSDPLSNLLMIKVHGANFSAIPFGANTEFRSGEIIFALTSQQNILPTSLIDPTFTETVVERSEVFNHEWSIDRPALSGTMPLCNASGELIGFARGDQATPLNQILPFVQSVLKDGQPIYAGLGAQIVDINTALNIDPELKMGQKEGALLTGLPKGPAKSSGLKLFDLITAIDGVPVTSADPVALQLKRYAPGAKIKLTVLRAGTSLEIEVTLGDYADLVY
jgi:S1-C subfamily serine protease